MIEELTGLLYAGTDAAHRGLVSAGVALAAVIVGLTIHSLLTWLVRRFHLKKGITLAGVRVEIEYLVGPFRLLFPAGLLMAVLPFLQFPDRIAAALERIVLLVVIAGLGWLAMRIINVTRDLILRKQDIHERDNLKARRLYTQIRVIERVVDVLTILITISIMLMTFPQVRKLGVSLLASAGVIGIILGFAAQKTLGNLFSGIQIALAQPIRIDDVVIVEGEWGRIEEITLTYVVVRIWDLRRLIVPISYFMEKPFQNWTRISADLLGTVFIYADYRIPVEKVREELKRILDESGKWDGEVWNLQVTNTTDRTVELRALMSAPDSSVAWDLRCLVREKLLAYLQANFPDCLPKVRLEMANGEQTDADMHSAS